MTEAIAIDYTPEMNELEPAVDMTPSHRTPSAIPIERAVDPNHSPVFGGWFVNVSALPSRERNYRTNKTEGRAVAVVGDLTATFTMGALEKSLFILNLPARQLFFRLCEVLLHKMGNPRLEQGRLVESDEEREERRTVYLSIPEYVNELGRSHDTREQRREVRQMLYQALAAIHSMSLDWKGKGGRFARLNVFSKQGSIDGNNIVVVFNEDFCKHARKVGLIQLPRAIRTISDKRPNAFSLCMKMAEHLSIDRNIVRRMNIIGKKKEIAAERRIDYPAVEESFELRTGRLSVATLLRQCGDLPTYAKVKKARASHKQKILTPFIANLRELQTCSDPYLQEFSFWLPRSEERVEESEFLKMDYHDAEKCIVQFTAKHELKGALDRIARKEQRKQESITKRNRKKKRQGEEEKGQKDTQ